MFILVATDDIYYFKRRFSYFGKRFNELDDWEDRQNDWTMTLFRVIAENKHLLFKKCVQGRVRIQILFYNLNNNFTIFGKNCVFKHGPADVTSTSASESRCACCSEHGGEKQAPQKV